MRPLVFSVCTLVSTSALLACDVEDDRPAEWSFIAPVILAPNCATASCHSRGAAQSGLDLSEPDVAYQGLLNGRARFRVDGLPAPGDPACQEERGGSVCETTRPLVQPCRPDESRLINMLHARGAQRMPPDRPMAIADIALIERWILAGAKRDPADATPSCSFTPVPDAAVAYDSGLGAGDAVAVDAPVPGVPEITPVGDASSNDGGRD